MKDKLQNISPIKYRYAQEGKMKVPAEFFVSGVLLEHLEDKAVTQLANVACLPGVQTKVAAMPDCHIGYGFPIGGVAAVDKEDGCISPGGIGFDINCGVRMLVTDLTKEDIEPHMQDLLESVFSYVPAGVGGESKLRLDDKQLDQVLTIGAKWALEQGYGTQEDLECCEEEGQMASADANKVSPRAKKRGRRQLGTLGAGNHFLEVQYVDEVRDESVASAYGITKPGQVVLMIHCGSRGLGHQVCSDYLRRMEDSYPDIVESLPEKDLIYAPAGSKLAADYFAAMSAAANFAWANRHIIAHYVRQAIGEVFPSATISTLYDVAHNIAKEEVHTVAEEDRTLWVHRKGATRAFGPGHPQIPSVYREAGQPIILPGSMGTASYVLAGSHTAEEQTFASTAHGAGRLMSRMAAKKEYPAEGVRRQLEKQKIYLKAASKKGISEEAPAVYKDVEEVVRVSDEAGIGTIVAKVRPYGVIKG